VWWTVLPIHHTETDPGIRTEDVSDAVYLGSLPAKSSAPLLPLDGRPEDATMGGADLIHEILRGAFILGVLIVVAEFVLAALKG
jgi:hypothetical protein